MESPNPDLRAYIVWAPFLNGDTEDAARRGTERYLAPQAAYFWSPSQRISAEMRGALTIGAGRQPWDVYLLYQRGAIWDREFPRPSYWQHQMEILQGDKFDPAVLRIRLRELLRRR